MTAGAAADTAAAAAHERQTVFRLQIVEDMTDAGLGGAKGFRCFGQASQFHGFDECFIFFQAHEVSSSFMRKIHVVLYIIT